MLQSVEQRIERVINNLLPATALEGKFGSPKTLDEQLVHYHTPGISIAVINDFEIEWARGFGVCEARTSREVTPNTLFQAASISKPVFALAVMRLAQEGRLNLDEDVNTYLTSWRVPAIGDWQPRVTLRQLLSHTAGLTVHGFPGYLNSEPLPTTIQVLNGEPPANTDKVEVNIIPGLHYRYSGGGTTVAQQVLVDLLKQPFPEIMRELVLNPLGMTNSTYQQPLPNDWSARAATAHPFSGIPLEGKHHVYPEMAAAGLWTTATDLAKVGVEILRVLRGLPATVWSKETIEEMLRPQQPEQTQGANESFVGLGNGLFVGLGFFAGGGIGDGFYFFHSGTNEGFVALMRVYAHIGKGAVVMLNSNEIELMPEVMRSLALEYDWPDVFPQEKPIITLSQTDSYSGLYLTKSGLQFKVMSQDGSLFLQCEQQLPLQFFPTSELEFFAKAANTSISFEKDDTGNITAMTLSQAGVMSLRQQADQQIRAQRQG
ncbi:serine hydrolase domain-containing protein [Brasilonema bromeliae]|uniref:Serine hydrolase n=1 Tax=Brasilonema bromeliae SPC951 TaxID=385972 RepID=A0ABX1P528_9CYAN|nr:serine hydrolase domain-containing protein [Brasilonema bromeliae]NMG19193.1 serine hydrolase [Brasilonema bromeliae SPC951]